MRLYILRVGETNSSKDNLIEGITNEDLNEVGKEQMEAIKYALDDIKIDCIYSSKLKRAVTTTDIIKKDEQVIFDDRLNERDAKGFANLPKTSIDYDDWWNYFPKREYNTETLSSLYKRTIEFIEEVKKTPYNDVLIITHNGVIACLNMYFKGMPDDYRISKYLVENAKIVYYEI